VEPEHLGKEMPGATEAQMMVIFPAAAAAAQARLEPMEL
jgi:hypothetical protein